jgi:hypothetical protein
LQAALRDTLVLLREFWSALLLFTITILAGGWGWMVLSNRVEPEAVSYVESVYTALTLVFFQGTENFPGEWYRQIFFFLMPILGLAFLGLGAAECCSIGSHARHNGR